MKCEGRTDLKAGEVMAQIPKTVADEVTSLKSQIFQRLLTSSSTGVKSAHASSSRPHQHRVLCVGDLSADIVASPAARLPQPGTTAMVEQIAVFPGGNALNTALALQHLGERAAYVSNMGDDALGDLLLDRLKAAGLDTRHIQRVPGGVTPATILYRAVGEDRRFITALGANARFTGEQIPLELIPRGGVLLIAGYYLLHVWNDEALIELMKAARRRRCRVVLNVCLPGGEVNPHRCWRLLPWVDVFVLNEDEARVLAGDMARSLQIRHLRQHGADTVVLTRGAKGLEAESPRQSVKLGVYKVKLVDPSCCGDCFNAGLIYGLLRRWDFVKTLQFASAVGALNATALGCTSGVPAPAEALRFMRSQSIAQAVGRM